jgi:hypothetical protein
LWVYYNAGDIVDNIYVVFGDNVIPQSVGIPMGTNCALLLADLFLYSFEAEFVHRLLQLCVYYNAGEIKIVVVSLL